MAAINHRQLKANETQRPYNRWQCISNANVNLMSGVKYMKIMANVMAENGSYVSQRNVSGYNSMANGQLMAFMCISHSWLRKRNG